ncbi:MAG: YjzC family protein [Leptolyngbya foveolarum]|uniref:YjzC family protein n=1 Tax=Leptolyngbya foveolarum TaxID=47253 RepID=A0A2W4UHF5_9CYAN|nr:MAG: YjzC family protein [Leptolyngbya foveolarum]
MANLQKPGEQPNKPGEYKEQGPRGGEVHKPRKVTMEEGDKPLPPTQEGGRTWKRIGPPKP